MSNASNFKPLEDKTWFVAPTEMPPVPEELPPSASREWQRLHPFLEAINRIARIDALPLAEYCMAWGRFDRLMETHFAHMDSDLTGDGPSCEVIHPALPPLLVASEQIFYYAEQWGLTARSRDLEGRQNIPTALKKLFGNRRKVAESKLERDVLPFMPSWQDEDMRPPVWANDRVIRLYNEVGGQLRLLDLFTPLDRVQLVVMVCLHDILLRAHEHLTSDFTDVCDKKTGDFRYHKTHPLHEVINRVSFITRRYYSAFGMTAKARRLLPKEEKIEASRPIAFRGRGK